MPCSMHLPKAILMMPILLGACTPSPSHSRVEVAMAVVAPPLDDATARRLQVSSVLLTSDSPDIDTEVRTAAARELMDLDRAEARVVLIEALRSKSIEPTKAVLDALRLGPTAHAELVDAVIEIMPATDPTLRETIGGLLSRFSQRYPDVVNRVAKQALDQQHGPNDRLAAVVALGGFRHAPAPAAAELMTILRRSDTEPDVVVIAAMEQLSRLTGLPPSGNRMQWLAWWEDNRNRPAERWLEDMVEALTRQVASTQQELDATREAELRMTARLLATYNEFWPLLPIDRQQAGLSALLQDDLGAVRAFGVDRLAILLRDGHASPEGQIAALTLLHDKDPTVRSKVAMILPELDPTLVSPAIPAALAREQDSAILNQLLGRAAALRLQSVDLTTIEPLLANHETRYAAADAMWAIQTQRPPMSQTQQDQLTPTIIEAWNAQPSPSLAALLILTNADEHIPGVLGYLDDQDPKWKQAVAEALLLTGRHDPLIQRATDEAIYPFTLVAVEQRDDDTKLARILALTPPQAQIGLWNSAVLKAAGEVPTSNRLTSDDLLSGYATITEVDRIALLQSALADDTLPDQSRAEIVSRLGPLVLRTGDPRVVVTMVDELPASTVDETLRSLKFEAALRGRLFDVAAGVHAEPTAWITAFERLEEAQPQAADLIRSEIVRRFSEQLDAAMRKQLGVAADPMMGEADEDAPPTR